MVLKVFGETIVSQKVTKVNSKLQKGGDFCMPAQWTADVIGEMHLKGITGKQLAEAIGWHPKYLSRVLNGHVEPEGAEHTIRSGLASLSSGPDAPDAPVA